MLLSPAIDSTSDAQGQRRALQQQRLDIAVLVAELDLQVVHLLAVAHEAKVARLDHAGVDRADAHLVHLLAAHLEERMVPHVLLALAFVAHRLEPGVARGCDAGLLPQLALEHLRRGVSGRERRIGGTARPAPAQHSQVTVFALQHGGGDRLAVGVHVSVDAAEQGDQALAGIQRQGDLAGPCHQIGLRHLVVQGHHNRLVRSHHWPPMDCATCTSRALIGAGV